MRKWLIGTLTALLLLILVGSYVFIPGTIRISRSISFNANSQGVFRFLSQPGNWERWWPAEKASSQLSYNGKNFVVTAVGFNMFTVVIDRDQVTDTALVHMVPRGIDSIRIAWDATINTGNNPVSRIRQYFRAKELAGDFETLLIAMKKYMSIVENMYGADIKRGKIKTEYMVLTKEPFDHRPSDTEIYMSIDRIRKHIAKIKATEEDIPFFNSTRVDSSRYELVVGVPITEPVADSGIFLNKKLLKDGNMLTADITGGQFSVDQAVEQFEAYVRDHQYQVVALPFQSFLTDRLNNDTSQWVTRIVFPIL